MNRFFFFSMLSLLLVGWRVCLVWMVVLVLGPPWGDLLGDFGWNKDSQKGTGKGKAVYWTESTSQGGRVGRFPEVQATLGTCGIAYYGVSLGWEELWNAGGGL